MAPTKTWLGRPAQELPSRAGRPCHCRIAVTGGTPVPLAVKGCLLTPAAFAERKATVTMNLVSLSERLTTNGKDGTPPLIATLKTFCDCREQSRVVHNKKINRFDGGTDDHRNRMTRGPLGTTRQHVKRTDNGNRDERNFRPSGDGEKPALDRAN